MNGKMGGEPWAISDMPKPFQEKPTMVVGYDVYHKASSNSYLAFTATTNRNFTKYFSDFIQQREYEEIANKL